MIVEEILSEGSFEHWPPELREELESHAHNERVGQTVRFEDGHVRLWSIILEPGQRFPFHRHARDYTWTALSSGTAVTRYGTGDAYRVAYVRGDLDFHHNEGGDFIHDLENVGDTVLEFVTLEFLR